MFDQVAKSPLSLTELAAQEVVELPDLDAEKSVELPARELLTSCGGGCGLLGLDVSASVSVQACVSVCL